MNFFERRKRLKGANYLELTPIRVVQHEVDQDQQVTILIPKFTNSIAKKYFEPLLKAKNIKLKLDELGSASWLEMGGNKKVAEISKVLKEKFGEKINPVDERLTKFLTLLYEQRLITFKEVQGD